jgi:hypothetical protein
MGLTVYNSSKTEGSMMYDDAFFQCIFLHFSQYYAHGDDAAASLGHFPKEDTPSQNLEASSRAGGAACKQNLTVHLGATPIRCTRFYKLLLT